MCGDQRVGWECVGGGVGIYIYIYTRNRDGRRGREAEHLHANARPAAAHTLADSSRHFCQKRPPHRGSSPPPPELNPPNTLH
eukprot:364514-Chlamydomonas_euryale.AAC.4